MLQSIAVQALQGLTVASVLFLVAAGLSIIWGLMDILNFAHGALFALGAYLGLVVVSLTGSFWLALIVAFVGVAVTGAVLEVATLRRLYGRDPLYFFLLTFGLTYVLTEGLRVIWGDNSLGLSGPSELSGAVNVGIVYPTYRLFVIVAAVVVGLAVWWVLQRTSFGLVLRAGTQNREMVSILGIDIGRIFTMGFALGTGLAGMAGVLVAPTSGLLPQMGVDQLLQAFVVVIIGGLGSYRGAALSAILVGEINSLGLLVLPGASAFLTYAAMIVVLLVKPSGLLGEGSS